MSTIFKTIETPGIAQLSYVVGDSATGTAAIIDPIPNIEPYLRIVRNNSLTITHIFETHIHADFMSGARTLANRIESAKLCASGESHAKYGFPVEKIHDGFTFDFGAVRLTARHTPGHTPEHLAFELSHPSANEPWGVLTGDSLFVGSAGRPDLLGDQHTETLVKQLWETLRNYYLKLDDSVMIFPGHGAGSACGANIGDRSVSNMGYERRTNSFLKFENFGSFKTFVIDTAPPAPHHYPVLKKINGQGPPILERVPAIPALHPSQFRDAIEARGTQLVDTRNMLAFGGGHIPGAINIGASAELPVWAGDMLDQDRGILLVVDDDQNIDAVVWPFVYTGFMKFSGYLSGGMKAWANAGLPLQMLPQTTVHDLNRRAEQFQIVDVRSPREWRFGHIPRATHLYVADMRDDFTPPKSLEKQRPVAVYCGSGYRASIAASILQRHGYTDVHNIPGSWQAWTNCGFEVAK